MTDIEIIREAREACEKSLTNPAGRHWVDIAIGYLTQVLDRLTAPPSESARELATVLAVGWQRSDEVGAPEDRPIVGTWIDDQGQPQTIPVVCIGGQWYGYDVHNDHPAELLFGYPPLFWIDLPGGAR